MEIKTGKDVKVLRSKMGLTQEQFGKKLGKNKDSISRLENSDTLNETTRLAVEALANESTFRMQDQNRVLTADDVKKVSEVMVYVVAGNYNSGTSFCSYFPADKEKLIKDLTENKNMSRYSNWRFEINGKIKAKEIPDDVEIEDIAIIIGEIVR